MSHYRTAWVNMSESQRIVRYKNKGIEMKGNNGRVKKKKEVVRYYNGVTTSVANARSKCSNSKWARGEKVLSKSRPGICMNPLATNLHAKIPIWFKLKHPFWLNSLVTGWQIYQVPHLIFSEHIHFILTHFLPVFCLWRVMNSRGIWVETHMGLARWVW